MPVVSGAILRVVVADDHALVRAGIVALLGDIPGIEVVGDAPRGDQAVRQAGARCPDLLFLGVDTPGLCGLDALALIRAAHPCLRIIVLSVHGGEELVQRALKLGAAGFVRKDAACDELAPAIDAVSGGEFWPCTSRATRVLSQQDRINDGNNGV